MAHRARQIRVLAIAPAEMQEALRHQIQSFGMTPTVVNSAAHLASHIRAGDEFDVVLLPSTLPGTEGWWEIWGDVALLSPKPAILVYAQTASFALWSGVLEAGGYDVVVEPFTNEKLKEALLRAAQGRGSTPFDPDAS